MDFDKVYYINLNRRPERLQHITKELEKASLIEIAERIEACDGADIDLSSASAFATPEGISHIQNRKGVNRWLTRGALGCALSHRDIWQRMVRDKVNMALVLEDDVAVPFDLSARLTQLAVSDSFDMFYLGYTVPRHDVPRMLKVTRFESLNDRYGTVKGVYGTFGYIITQDCAQKLLSLFPITHQIDAHLFDDSDTLQIRKLAMHPDHRIIKHVYQGTDVQTHEEAKHAN